MECDQPVKDGLEPGIAPGVMGASTISVGNEEVAGIGRGLGEKGHLMEEVSGCLREVVAVN